MSTYAELRNSKPARMSITVTGVGITAICAALPSVVMLFRGEPQAQETFQYLKKSSAQLLENQHVQHDRLVRLESTIEAYSLVRKEQREDITQKLLLMMTGAIATRRTPAVNVPAPAPAPSVKSGGGSMDVRLRCRAGHVQEGARCVPMKQALASKEAEVDAVIKEKKQLKELLLHERKTRQIQQRPRGAPLPAKLAD